MSEQPLLNSTEARTETGEIKDQSQPTTTETTSPSSTSVTTSTEKEGTLLNPEKTPEKAVEKPVVPEKYEFKAPEGYEIDKAFAEAATAAFKELNLTQAQADKLTELYTAKAQEMAEAPYKAYETMKAEWREQANNHPDLKGKLAPGGEVLTTVSRALDSLGDPALVKDFREAMNLTAAGDHPAFIRAFYKLAQAVTEGKPVSGKGPSPFGQGQSSSRPTVARAIYPTLPSS